MTGITTVNSNLGKINRNMRCIEIDQNTQKILDQNRINRNMRCIEISVLS